MSTILVMNNFFHFSYATVQKVSFDAPIQSGFSEAQPGQASAWDDHDDKVGLKY